MLREVAAGTPDSSIHWPGMAHIYMKVASARKNMSEAHIYGHSQLVKVLRSIESAANNLAGLPHASVTLWRGKHQSGNFELLFRHLPSCLLCSDTQSRNKFISDCAFSNPLHCLLLSYLLSECRLRWRTFSYDHFLRNINYVLPRQLQTTNESLAIFDRI